MRTLVFLLFFAIILLGLDSLRAAEPPVCPPGCVDDASVRECPPGTAPVGINWCQEVRRDCETVRDPLPSGETIRSVAAQQVKVLSIPAAVKPFVDEALSWPGMALEDAFYRAVAAARCFSGGDKGPSDPDAVPDAQVKQWMLAVLGRGEARDRALRPLVASLPDSLVATAWRTAVRLKRSLK